MTHATIYSVPFYSQKKKVFLVMTPTMLQISDKFYDGYVLATDPEPVLN